MDHPDSVHKGLTGIPQREITLTEHVIVAADHAYFITVFEPYWQCKRIQRTAYLLQSKTDIWSYPADTMKLDFELNKVLLPPPPGNFADISYLEENVKPHLLRDVCTLCSGVLISDSLLHMLL